MAAQRARGARLLRRARPVRAVVLCLAANHPATQSTGGSKVEAAPAASQGPHGYPWVAWLPSRRPARLRAGDDRGARAGSRSPASGRPCRPRAGGVRCRHAAGAPRRPRRGAAMLSLPLPVRIFLCTQPADMRRSFDGLAQMVREFLRADPLSGHLFIFRSKRGDRLKLLYWDTDGLAIWYKRLEEGTFRFPAASAQGYGIEIRAADLAMLLDGVDLESVKRRKRYRQPAATGE